MMLNQIKYHLLNARILIRLLSSPNGIADGIKNMRKQNLTQIIQNIMTKQKTQAYDLTEKTKSAIQKICIEEQRSESFIVSRILNKMFDPLNEVKK